MEKLRGKDSQTWSTDVLLGAVLFSMIFIALFYIIGIRSTSEIVSELQSESNNIPIRFMSETTESNETVIFIINNKVIKTRLKEVSNMTYPSLKRDLGVQHDFAFYFEDEYGNLINISDITVGQTPCIGSPNATLNGVPCR